MSSRPQADSTSIDLADEHSANERLAHRAAAGARVMTVRGALMRGVGIASTVILLAFVTPEEYGLAAIVRGVVLALELLADLGFSQAMIRRTAEPRRAEYAALGGQQSLLLLAALVVAWRWPAPVLAFGAVDARWHHAMLAVMLSLCLLPLGIGARVRLERALEYRKLAFVELSALLLQNAGLLAFAYAGRFTTGLFVVVATSALYTHGALFLLSPGPLPSPWIAPLRPLAGDAARFASATALTIGYQQLTPAVVARGYGLSAAGLWAFAMRIAFLLNVTFDGFWRAAVPVAPRLAHDPQTLRRFTTRSLAGVARLTLPATGVLVAGLPALAAFWPTWAPGIPLAQLYALCVGVWGVTWATLDPVAVAVRGPGVALAERAAALGISWLGILLAARSGQASFGLVVVLMHLVPIAILVGAVDRRLLPAWSPELGRALGGLGSTLGVYVVGRLVHAPPMLVALAAVVAAAAWLGSAPRPRVALGAQR